MKKIVLTVYILLLLLVIAGVVVTPSTTLVKMMGVVSIVFNGVFVLLFFCRYHKPFRVG